MDNTLALHASEKELEQGVPLEDVRPPDPKDEPEGIILRHTNTTHRQ